MQGPAASAESAEWSELSSLDTLSPDAGHHMTCYARLQHHSTKMTPLAAEPQLSGLL